MSVRGAEQRARVRAWWRTIRPGLLAQAVDALGDADGQAFAARADVVVDELHEAVDDVYTPLGYGADDLVLRLVMLSLATARDRSPALRVLDHRREIDPQWFLRAHQLGYVAHADRFAGTLQGVRDRLEHLEELGVTYLHLMPLLQPRPGESDGGHAVADHDQVDPRLGTMDDLEALATDLHQLDMALCIDLVVNHTAAEHPWAQAARAGDERHKRFYRIYPSRREPDEYEQTLREVVPDVAPGSFTEVDGLGWVWTTFREWQWDLNYANPDVLTAMCEVMGRLANRGVDVLRLDGVPFLWKQKGTDCENLPEAHRIVQILRAVLRISAPGVICKAEALVPPEQLVQYLGGHEPEVRECELAYHNQVMVMLWSSLASRDARLMSHALQAVRRPPVGTGWVTYVRSHDDIGWAVRDEDAAAVGWDGVEHRSFLDRFYAGEHEASWAQGVRVPSNRLADGGRISGTTAALCGIDDARERGDDEALYFAIRRFLLLHAVVLGWGGSVPVLHMGDEVAMANDRPSVDRTDPATDDRGVHRPAMDWDAVDRRHDPRSVEGRVFAGLRRQVDARRDLPVLRGGGDTVPWWTGHPSVFAWRRTHPRHRTFLGLAAFADGPTSIARHVMADAGLRNPTVALASDGGVKIEDDEIQLPPWGWAWLAD